MTSILSELPKAYSDSARAIIQQHLRRGTSGTYSFRISCKREGNQLFS